jgi:hypothetical protein
MMIKMIAGMTRTLGKAQGYLGLPVRDETIMSPEVGNVPAMVSAWEPAPDEIAAIAAGGTVYLRVLGVAHPPVMIWAEPPPQVTHG